jgi:hypothetical protein
LVVLGNPPYNAFAGTSPEEEQGLVEPYKEGLIKTWRIKKFNLDEFYVRFMRLAQRRIAEGTKQGVVCYISSFSYIADPSFVVMRKLLLDDFDSVWIDCLNGDSRETGKKTPEGEADPSVFSTKFNAAGIRLGTSVGLFARKLAHQPAKRVAYRDFWGRSKRQDLLDSLSDSGGHFPYAEASPSKDNRFSFRPQKVSPAFRSWPRAVDLCEAEPIAGLQEMRFGSLMSIDREPLEQRMSRYLDPEQSWAEIRATGSGPIRDAGGFKAEKVRQNLLGKETFSVSKIRRYSLYPLDNRWAYWSSVPTFWNRARPQLVSNSSAENRFFVTRMTAERPDEGIPAVVTPALPDYHLLRPNVVAIPFMLEHQGEGLFAGERRANLSGSARAYLKKIGFDDPDTSTTAQLVWLHALAICFSPQYLSEHRDGVLTDWPRIPLPNNKSVLQLSAALGDRIAALLDPDRLAPGVSDGNINPSLLPLGALSRLDGKPLTPSDLVLTAGWGHRTSTGAIMPGGGRVKEHAATPSESAAISEKDRERLGPPLDVFLNDVAIWHAIPLNVWEYRIGGYQVIKKWLSYREEPILGRPLTKEEARHVTATVRRIAAIILITDELDANYSAASGGAIAWPDFKKANGDPG